MEQMQMTNSLRQFLWILLVITKLCVTVTSYEHEDFCPTVPECKCWREQTRVTQEWGLTIRCKEFTTDVLDRIPSKNATSLLLYGGTKNNTTELLVNLRHKARNLENLTITDCNLETFELRWLPDAAFLKLVLTRNKLKHMVASSENDTTCEDEQRRLSKMKVISFTSEGLLILPVCMPESIEVIFIQNTPAFAQSAKAIQWPTSMRHLKIKMMDEGHMPTHMFDLVTDNLIVLWVNHSPMKDGILPSLPKSINLKNLYFQHGNLSQIQHNSFTNMTGLRSLDLASNNLAKFDVEIPQSLQNLRLYGNQIEQTPSNWLDSNLIAIDLGRNRLETVPLRLPKTLKKLQLYNNNIVYCDPDVFTHLKNLEQLDLSYNQLTRMPTGINPEILMYRLNNNKFSDVPGSEAYEFCTNCGIFDIRQNQWSCSQNFVKMLLWMTKNIPRTALGVFKATGVGGWGYCGVLSEHAFTPEWLQITSDYMEYISKPPFDRCIFNVQKTLNCTNLGLKYYPNPPPEGLKRVIVDGNPELRVTPDNQFASLTSLQILQLSNNSLKRIPYGIPSSLLELNLRRNNITEFTERDVKIFQTLINLKELYLEENHLKMIYDSQLSPLVNLKWIGLETNDLECNCSLLSFILWYNDLVPRSVKRIGPRYARCQSPAELHDSDVRSVMSYYDYEFGCVPVSCSYPRTGYQTGMDTLNCSGKIKLTETDLYYYQTSQIHGKMPIIKSNLMWVNIYLDSLGLTNEAITNLTSFTRLVHLDLSNNSLMLYPTEFLPSSLEELILAKNRMTFLPDKNHIGKFLPRLRLLDLQNNHISMITGHQLTFLPLMHRVLLEGNPFECDCRLREFIHWVKSNKENENVTTAFNLEGVTCQTPKKLQNKPLMTIAEEEYCKNNYSEIVGGLVGALIGVTCLIVVISLHLRRKRQELTKREILIGFQKLVQQEATFSAINVETGIPLREFKYEAFVSSTTGGTDGEFLDKLMQELEQKRGYRLCIGERDFAPGTSVADNIVECIGASKRIILVLSQNFASSPWCQYEIQVALAELHERRSKLLVPIMIENLTTDDDLPGGLKSFLSLVPIIHTPRKQSSAVEWQKFWNKVTSAVPKK